MVICRERDSYLQRDRGKGREREMQSFAERYMQSCRQRGGERDAILFRGRDAVILEVGIIMDQ